MVLRFSVVGVVTKLHGRHINARGESIAITLGLDDESIVCVTTGRILEVVDLQLQIGDVVYVEGRLKRDGSSTLEIPKNVLLLYVNHLSIVLGGKQDGYQNPKYST